MKKYTLFSVCCLISLVTAMSVTAQGFIGPGPYSTSPGATPATPGTGWYGYGYGYTGEVRTVTIEQARTFPHKTPVVIRGTIVQALGGDFFTFRDSTGDIILKIGPKEWYWIGSSIGPSDTIEISGEIHYPPRSWQYIPEFHARYIRKI